MNVEINVIIIYLIVAWIQMLLDDGDQLKKGGMMLLVEPLSSNP